MQDTSSLQPPEEQPKASSPSEENQLTQTSGEETPSSSAPSSKDLPQWLRSELGAGSPQEIEKVGATPEGMDREARQPHEELASAGRQMAALRHPLSSMPERQSPVQFERGGCLTAWLVFVGIANVLVLIFGFAMTSSWGPISLLYVVNGAMRRFVLLGLAVLLILALAGGTTWFITHQPGFITEFPLPGANSVPYAITRGADGNLWFTEESANGSQIGRVSTGGSITMFPVPITSGGLPGIGPQGITAGPNGNLWFTEVDANQIGRISPSGTITEFPIPTANCFPEGITTGPDGNLWFIEVGHKIGRISPSGSITEFPLTTISDLSGSVPNEIVAGPDGNLWFTEVSANRIGRISPSGSITEFPVPMPIPTDNNGQIENGLSGIVAGPDGNLWFTEVSANKIGRISPSGSITAFPIPTAKGDPVGITSGPDGNLWFTESNGNKIGRITPSGTVTEFAIPTLHSFPEGIAAGPDGNLWFTEGNGKIGRIISGK
ncbi:MAG TPA: hypothetical protein VFA10_18900 [Ktedonobacteraceae bacterium]|nr:hypothetical protein [Ktedonobacteraceae bacterium]